MSNALRYIRSLEAAGVPRAQAEAQVQMVLDILEGDIATKSDLGLLKGDLVVLSEKMDSKFARVDARFAELELKLISRLGGLVVGGFTITIAFLSWLIKTT